MILYCFVGTSADLQCDQCQKIYCSKSNLNHHKKTQHKQVVLLWKLDGEEYKCDVCQKRFPGPAHLKRHSNVHEKTRYNTCNVCQKIFLVPLKLK